MYTPMQWSLPDNYEYPVNLEAMYQKIQRYCDINQPDPEEVMG